MKKQDFYKPPRWTCGSCGKGFKLDERMVVAEYAVKTEAGFERELWEASYYHAGCHHARKVVVEIKGGVATVSRWPKDTEVVVKDYD